MRSRPRRPFLIIVEDDACMRRSLSTVLRADYGVVELGDGLELIERLRPGYRCDEVPALIVLDVQVPGMTGLAALREIRSWGSRVPIILVTDLPSDDTLDEAFRLGATAVFVKPLDVEDLRIAIGCFVPGVPFDRS